MAEIRKETRRLQEVQNLESKGTKKGFFTVSIPVIFTIVFLVLDRQKKPKKAGNPRYMESIAKARAAKAQKK